MPHKRLAAPINTIKHYVHTPKTAIGVGAILEIVVVDAVSVASAGSNAFDVEEGALVKAVWLEYWLTSNNTIQTGASVATFCKLPNASAAPTVAQMSNLGSWDNKKNVFVAFEGLVPAEEGANPVPIFRGWYKVPKGKQRMGLGDKLSVTFGNISEGLNVCGFATYKEWK